MDEKTIKIAEKPEDLSQKDMARLVIDMFYRTMVHHTLWFSEVEHQLGLPKALEMMKVARENSYKIQMDRLAKTLVSRWRMAFPRPS